MVSPGNAWPKIGAVILAGGLSRRMGRPKALIPISGSTFLEKILFTYKTSGISDLLVITHKGVAEESEFPSLEKVDLLVIEKATDSPLQTLWLGLSRIQKIWAAFFVHPVDHPYVLAKTLETLADVFRKEKAPIIQPRYCGRGGHPILMNINLIPEIKSASPEEGLRQVVRADPFRVRRVSVEDPGILKGVNRPSDLPGSSPV